MQCPLHPHHTSSSAGLSLRRGSRGVSLVLPFWVSHGKCVSCVIGAPFTGLRVMLGCPGMGWEPRSAGGREGDVVSWAVEGTGLWLGRRCRTFCPIQPSLTPSAVPLPGAWARFSLFFTQNCLLFSVLTCSLGHSSCNILVPS